jgi:hypothetical protein
MLVIGSSSTNVPVETLRKNVDKASSPLNGISLDLNNLKEMFSHTNFLESSNHKVLQTKSKESVLTAIKEIVNAGDRDDLLENSCTIWYTGHGCEGTGAWAIDGWGSYNYITLD